VAEETSWPSWLVKHLFRSILHRDSVSVMLSFIIVLAFSEARNYEGAKARRGEVVPAYQVQLYPKISVLSFRQYIPSAWSTNFKPG